MSWLDDHARYLLACTACGRIGGDDVVATFTAAGDAHGWPAATLTDNAAVCTSRFTGGRNGFEYLLAWLGVRQKNGMPGHPQTQGKVERFQQTLKRWLGRQPVARDLADLGVQLDAFRTLYNEHRPHRALGRRTPDAGGSLCRPAQGPPRGAWRTGPLPAPVRRHRRQRRDHPPAGGRMHHLHVGTTHARRRVLAIVDEREISVVALDTGELRSTHLIEPDKAYWRNQRRDPGRWPGSSVIG